MTIPCQVGDQRGKLHRMMQAAVEFDTSTQEAIANSFARLACQQLRYVIVLYNMCQSLHTVKLRYVIVQIFTYSLSSRCSSQVRPVSPKYSDHTGPCKKPMDNVWAGALLVGLGAPHSHP